MQRKINQSSSKKKQKLQQRSSRAEAAAFGGGMALVAEVDQEADEGEAADHHHDFDLFNRKKTK